MHEDLVRWFNENQRALPWRVDYNPQRPHSALRRTTPKQLANSL